MTHNTHSGDALGVGRLPGVQLDGLHAGYDFAGQLYALVGVEHDLPADAGLLPGHPGGGGDEGYGDGEAGEGGQPRQNARQQRQHHQNLHSRRSSVAVLQGAETKPRGTGPAKY